MKKTSTSALLLFALAAGACGNGCSDDSASPSDSDAADAAGSSDAAVVPDGAIGDDASDGAGAFGSESDATAVADAVAQNDVFSDAAEGSDAGDVFPDIIAEPVPINRGEPDIDLEGISGFDVMQLTYSEPRLGQDRTLDVQLWYATTATEGEPALFTPELPLFSDFFALLDAPVLPPADGVLAPMVLYSHGGRGFSGQISTVARQFVRNGWVVVAPTHPGENLFDFDESLPSCFPVIRAADTIAALNMMENLPAEHPLAGRVDTSRVLAMGHSYGGQNSWLMAGLPLDIEGIRERCSGSCQPEDVAAWEAFVPDPRIVAGISLDCPIDQNLFPDDGYSEVRLPMLHITGTEGNDGTGFFARADAADLTWVSLLGGCHESITGSRPCQTLDLPTSQAAAATYVVAFGTAHILGSEDPTLLDILDGSIEVSDKAVVRLSSGAQP